MNLDNSSICMVSEDKNKRSLLKLIYIYRIYNLGREPFSYKKPGQSRAYRLSKQDNKVHAFFCSLKMM